MLEYFIHLQRNFKLQKDGYKSIGENIYTCCGNAVSASWTYIHADMKDSGLHQEKVGLFVMWHTW